MAHDGEHSAARGSRRDAPDDAGSNALESVFARVALQVDAARQSALQVHREELAALKSEIGAVVLERDVLQGENERLQQRVLALEERVAELEGGRASDKEALDTIRRASSTRDKGDKKKSKSDRDLTSVCRDLSDWLAAPTDDAAKVVGATLEKLQRLVSSGASGSSSTGSVNSIAARAVREDSGDASDGASPATSGTVFLTALESGSAPRLRSLSSTSKEMQQTAKMVAAASSKARARELGRHNSGGKSTKSKHGHREAEAVIGGALDKAVPHGRRRSNSTGEHGLLATRRSASMLSMTPSAASTVNSTELKPEPAVEQRDAYIGDDAQEDDEPATAEQTRHEAAAMTIQRAWRYKRVQVQFSSMIKSMKERSNAPAKARPMPRKSSVALLGPGELGRRQSTAFMDPGEQSLIQGIYEFNQNPKKGIKLLIESGCLPEDDDEDVARFLLTDKRLNKTKVGEYLGLGEETTERVKECFVELIDFTGLSFDLAMRKFLSDSNFRLPGEAQKIDRLVESFARCFHEKNAEDVLANADAVHVLAYSTIMLNTDAHNPNVKKRMSLPEFVKNNRGINNKADLPEEYLRKLYVSIVNNEIRLKEDDQCSRVFETIDRVADIEGFKEAFVQPYRRLVREMDTREIPDQSLFQPLETKADRRVFVFSDVMLIVRYSTRRKRNEFRYMFHFIRMKVLEVKDSAWNQNVVELSNPDGRLVTLSFSTLEDKVAFMRTIKTQASEVASLASVYHDKLRELIVIAGRVPKHSHTQIDRTLSRRVGDLFRTRQSISTHINVDKSVVTLPTVDEQPRTPRKDGDTMDSPYSPSAESHPYNKTPNVSANELGTPTTGDSGSTVASGAFPPPATTGGSQTSITGSEWSSEGTTRLHRSSSVNASGGRKYIS